MIASPTHSYPIPDTPEYPEQEIISDEPLIVSQLQVPPLVNRLPFHKQLQTIPITAMSRSSNSDFFHSKTLKKPSPISISYPFDILYLWNFILMLIFLCYFNNYESIVFWITTFQDTTHRVIFGKISSSYLDISAFIEFSTEEILNEEFDLFNLNN